MAGFDLAETAAADAAVALAEDRIDADRLAGLGDRKASVQAAVIVRQQCVVAGCAWFDACVQQAAAQLDLPAARINWLVREGDQADSGSRIVAVNAAAGVLLAAERSALNFLGLLAAVATKARMISQRAEPVPVYDTRKTLPGLRAAQKHAVQVGGMKANRANLAEVALIKENHIKVAGSIGAAYELAQTRCPADKIQIEVESETQLAEALQLGAKRIMLDNFSPQQVKKAVEQVAGKAELEASGSIDANNIAAYAASGIDRISTSAATKEAGCIDLSMQII